MLNREFSKLCTSLATYEKNDQLGKMYSNTLAMHQLVAGISRPILEDTTTTLPYLTPGIFTSLRNFLASTNCSIQASTQKKFLLPRENDHCIMDIMTSQNYSNRQLKQINACQLYLQVITLSDITDGSGNQILREAMDGRPIPTSTSNLIWPRQHFPSQQSWVTWRSAIRKVWLLYSRRYTMKPSHWLGEWNEQRFHHHRQWTYAIEPRTGRLWHHHHNGNFTICNALTATRLRTYVVNQANPATLTEWTLSARHTTPASILNRNQRFIYYSAYRFITPNENPSVTIQTQLPAPTLAHWISTQPTWLQYLLQHHRHAIPTTQLIQALNTSSPLTIDTTSTHPHRHQWRLRSNGNTLWLGHGPTINTDNTATTLRAQLQSILAGLSLLIGLWNTMATSTTDRRVTLHLPPKRATTILQIKPHNHKAGALKYTTKEYDTISQIHQMAQTYNIQLSYETHPIVTRNTGTTPLDEAHAQAQPAIHFPANPTRLISDTHTLTGNIAQDLRKNSLMAGYQPSKTFTYMDTTQPHYAPDVNNMRKQTFTSFNANGRMTMTSKPKDWRPSKSLFLMDLVIYSQQHLLTALTRGLTQPHNQLTTISFRTNPPTYFMPPPNYKTT